MEGRARATESPAAFTEHVSRGLWHPAPHLGLTDQYLRKLANREIRRLMICEPPRHGKSELCSAHFPAWWLGKFPNQRVILASYAEDFASHWGRRNRDLIDEFGLQLFGIEVSEASKAAHRWDLKGRRGGMVCAGVGGAITGRGADLLVVDDPIKNKEEAHSKTVRDAVWDWWRSVLLTRLEPDAVILLIMTRWHEDDLFGRILAEDADRHEWTTLILPAIAEEGEPDLLGRQPGQALWPERYDEVDLEQKKRDLGSYFWHALYQQTPMPDEGTLFRRQDFRYAERLDDNFYALHRGEETTLVPCDTCITFQTVDLAVSTTDAADYTVIGTWARTPNRDLILLDIIRVKVEGPDQLGLVATALRRWDAAVVGIERTQYQLSLVQAARRAGLPVIELKADRNKVARAITMSARYEAGTVFHTRGPWLDEYEAELLSFDNGKHDDQVDVAAYAAQFLLQRGQGVKVSVIG